jgi:hypothetical protein
MSHDREKKCLDDRIIVDTSSRRAVPSSSTGWRVKASGGAWQGAEAILTLRSLKKSHDNDLRDYWKFRARQMHGRLYGHKPKYRPTPRLRCVA